MIAMLGVHSRIQNIVKVACASLRTGTFLRMPSSSPTYTATPHSDRGTLLSSCYSLRVVVSETPDLFFSFVSLQMFRTRQSVE